MFTPESSTLRLYCCFSFACPWAGRYVHRLAALVPLWGTLWHIDHRHPNVFSCSLSCRVYRLNFMAMTAVYGGPKEPQSLHKTLYTHISIKTIKKIWKYYNVLLEAHELNCQGF